MGRREVSKKKSGKGKKLVILTVVLIILAAIAAVIYYYISNNAINAGLNLKIGNPFAGNLSKEEETEKQIKVFKGNERPIAVMIDNHVDARPQANLNKAYILYEIIVEGGETRLMAVYKGQNLDKIGPIRSSRHYFLDYALENDAIYVHYGWSPQAEKDISGLRVNNINGMVETSTDFWRDKAKSAPHNAVTNTANILKLAEKKKYRTASDSPSLLNYVTDSVNLETGEDAYKVTIPYSLQQTVEYRYDVQRKEYIRYSKNKIQTDWATGEDVVAKNLIITFVKNTKMDDIESKDRQNIYNIGKMDGYYITNGKYIKITCEKTSRESKTIYRDLSGNVIDVNDGNTFIGIVPHDAKVKFEGLAE